MSTKNTLPKAAEIINDNHLNLFGHYIPRARSEGKPIPIPYALTELTMYFKFETDNQGATSRSIIVNDATICKVEAYEKNQITYIKCTHQPY